MALLSEIGALADLSPAERAESAASWVQISVTPARARLRELYGELSALASRLLEDRVITNFFYMHKPPGLRVRFQAGRVDRAALTISLRQRIDAWQARGLAERVTGGVYEPEQTLFGGPSSMPFVHRLFTVDAMAWLAFHELSAPCPAWAFSLGMVPGLLDGLGIDGWEDLDVWDRIRRQAGRRLPQALPPARIAPAVTGIAATWAECRRLTASLPGQAAALVGRHRPRLEAEAARWASGYFHDGAAVIGPREAAAFFVVFHWNRGALTPATQALIATALSDPAVALW